MKFARFLRTPIFTEYLRWLLMNLDKYQDKMLPEIYQSIMQKTAGPFPL